MADTSGAGVAVDQNAPDASFDPSTINAVALTSVGTQQAASMWQWMFGYTVLFIILWLINKSRIGHTAIYYSLLLMIVFTLVSHPREIADAMAVFGTSLRRPSPGLAGQTHTT